MYSTTTFKFLSIWVTPWSQSHFSPLLLPGANPFQLTHSDSRWLWMVRTGSCPVQVCLLTSLSVFTPLLHCSGWLVTGQEWCWSVGQGLASAVDGRGLKDPKIQVTQAVKKAREGIEPPSTESESVVLTATPTSHAWAMHGVKLTLDTQPRVLRSNVFKLMVCNLFWPPHD